MNTGFFLALRKLYKPTAPIYYCMYVATPDVQIGTYLDLWQKDRYHVELAAQLYCEPNDIDKALEQLGYEIVDADQWGRSYHHNKGHNKIIELDELEDPTALVRLILRYSDLDEADTDQAENQLDSLYTQICQMCKNNYDSKYNDYDCLYQPADLEADPHYTYIPDDWRMRN